MSPAATRSNPFPGLRPFASDEAHLFFGRDRQTTELLSRLAEWRFVAVLGASGSGKSSLVRAGLLPSLHGGFVSGGGTSWRTALFRPGADPIGNMARALLSTGAYGGSEWDETLQREAIEATLRRSGLGLVEAVRQARLPRGETVLIVIDQFEELFRFKHASPVARAGDEASAFVKLFLEAVGQTRVPLYAVLTMRSDFLGDCSEFRDLPERINESLYLIPRMRRDELREAVTGPIAVGGGGMTQRLVERLLNDVGDDPDQLPVLQHALMRLWERWNDDREYSTPIDLSHYQRIGGMQQALSIHADEAYNELNRHRQRVAATMFRALTEKGPDNRELRRPSSVEELVAVTGSREETVAEIIGLFRAKDRSFLMVSEDGVVDISHESLIRQWERLRGWVAEEAKSREIFTRIADAAERHERGEAALLRDPELQLAQDWWERQEPSEPWARRYRPDFSRAETFLRKSLEIRDAGKRWAAPVEGTEELWGPLAERYLEHRPRKLLAIDGGPLPQGVLAIEILGRIERLVRQQLGRPKLVLGDYFDYVAGTGTGGVIAACLARGLDVDTIRLLYHENWARLERASILRFFKHQYRHEQLARSLQEVFGAETDLSPQNLRCLLLVVVGDAKANAPWPISSNPMAKYNAPDRPDRVLKLPLWQLARASSASQAAFPPEEVRLLPESPGKNLVLEDGSLTPYANPAFLLYRMATQAPYRLGWMPGEKQMLLVSVGTGIKPDVKRDENPTERTIFTQLSRLTSRVAARLDQDILCRTVGRCVFGGLLDREQGDLIPRYQTTGETIPLTQDLGRDFLYARYDAELTQPALAHLGLSDIDADQLKISEPEALEELRRIGVAVAEQVSIDHFGPFLAK